MSVIKNYSKDANYWDLDPQLTAFEPFKTLYDSDKTKGKRGSSQKMWAVAFYIDPDSRLYKYKAAEKKKVIESDIITIKGFDWKELEEPIKIYKKLNMTQAERTLDTWNLKLEERERYLLSIDYKELTLEEAKKFDTLITNHPAMYDQYEMILAKISAEEVEGKTKGNRKESLSEKKII